MILYIYKLKNYIINTHNFDPKKDTYLIASIDGKTNEECEEIAEIYFGDNDQYFWSYNEDVTITKDLDYKEIEIE